MDTYLSSYLVCLCYTGNQVIFSWEVSSQERPTIRKPTAKPSQETSSIRFFFYLSFSFKLTVTSTSTDEMPVHSSGNSGGHQGCQVWIQRHNRTDFFLKNSFLFFFRKRTRMPRKVVRRRFEPLNVTRPQKMRSKGRSTLQPTNEPIYFSFEWKLKGIHHPNLFSRQFQSAVPLQEQVKKWQKTKQLNTNRPWITHTNMLIMNSPFIPPPPTKIYPFFTKIIIIGRKCVKNS